ncbi:hypothetical protein JTB14_027919 [Gonioctena quinquepunctata]|nr:hypothetical protein JTB14_027919 [Gonioctena quinquepunctata]
MQAMGGTADEYGGSIPWDKLFASLQSYSTLSINKKNDSTIRYGKGRQLENYSTIIPQRNVFSIRSNDIDNIVLNTCLYLLYSKLYSYTGKSSSSRNLLEQPKSLLIIKTSTQNTTVMSHIARELYHECNNPFLKIEARIGISQSHETFPMNIVVNPVPFSPFPNTNKEHKNMGTQSCIIGKSKHRNPGEKFSQQTNSRVFHNERHADR